MDTTNTQPRQITLVLQRFSASVWRTLCTPATTGILLALLATALLLLLILPQQSGPNTSAESWTSTLPAAVQPWGSLLFALGFSRIFQSIWFWALLGLLLLNTLVALAELSPPSWRRVRQTPADIGWQHPLAQRVEHSVRLSSAPDAHLSGLAESLERGGFTVDPAAEEQRQVSGGKHRRVWLALPAFYGAVLLLVLAFLLTFVSLKTEDFTLWPHATNDSQLFGGTVELYNFDEESGSGVVIFDPADDTQPATAFFLSPYRPAIYRQTLIWATAAAPVLTIEAADSGGRPRRLMPVQANVPPGTQLSLPLDQPDAPLYFLIPSAELAFQILPVESPQEGGYNVQVRRKNETAPSENLMVQAGQTFEIDGLSLTLTLDHSLSVSARRDFGLLLYPAALLLMLACAALLWLLPPWQVWLIPDVKGRGGQLYGVAEKFGAMGGAAEFLRDLLRHEVEQEDGERGR